VKILNLIQCTNLGGMEQSTVLLLDEFKRLGHEVELLSLNEIGPLGPVLQQHGIPASAVGYRGKWGWRSFLPLRRLLRTKRADALVMVGHNLMAMLALGDFCRGRRILSLHFHHEGVKPGWAWRLIYRVAAWRFKRIIYPSNFIMQEALGIVPQLVRTRRTVSYPIPSPISLPPVAEAAQGLDCRTKLGLAGEHKVVGNAGWLIPRKRWDVYLEVAARVAAAVPEARFLIAGDGPERKRLERRAAELQIVERVVWLGWQKDLSTFYRTLDVMLFNSDWDAMGRTPLEAMSYGIPVVASVQHGGLKEMLNSDEYGFLINTHDVPLLARKVVELLQDRRLAEGVGARARAHIEKVGDPRMHAKRVLSLLAEGKQPELPAA
jgi:glycosyltransferase involved in cell wall biosynthesis